MAERKIITAEKRGEPMSNGKKVGLFTAILVLMVFSVPNEAVSVQYGEKIGKAVNKFRRLHPKKESKKNANLPPQY